MKKKVSFILVLLFFVIMGFFVVNVEANEINEDEEISEEFEDSFKKFAEKGEKIANLEKKNFKKIKDSSILNSKDDLLKVKPLKETLKGFKYIVDVIENTFMGIPVIRDIVPIPSVYLLGEAIGEVSTNTNFSYKNVKQESDKFILSLNKFANTFKDKSNFEKLLEVGLEVNTKKLEKKNIERKKDILKDFYNKFLEERPIHINNERYHNKNNFSKMIDSIG